MIVFAMLVAVAISMVVIPIMWRLAPAFGLIDLPDPRKVHRAPVPRVGGWGIVLGALAAVLIATDFNPLVQAYIAGALILFISGAVDDRHDLGHYPKFVCQFAAVALVVFWGGLWIERWPFLGLYEMPAVLGMPLTLVCMVGAINAINHSDGLDGLAGGETLLSLLAIAVLAWIVDDPLALAIAAAVAGGVLGFMRFNTHPARIFMGDSGSQFLGYSLAVLVIELTQNSSSALSAALPALLLGLPIVDILAVLYLRIRGGLNWFKATRNHIHHRLLDLGFVHYEVVIIIYSVQALMVLAALALRFESDLIILSTYLSLVMAVFSAITLAERAGWRAQHSEGRTVLAWVTRLTAHDWLQRMPLMLVATGVPIFLIVASMSVHEIPRDFAVSAGVLACVGTAELAFGRSSAVMARLCTYAAAGFCVYLTVSTGVPLRIGLHAAELGYFAILAVAIALSVRYGQEQSFHTTPTDYLIVFVMLTVGIVAARSPEMRDTLGMFVRGAVLLYGCELLLNRPGRGRFNLLFLSSLASLFVLAWRGGVIAT